MPLPGLPLFPRIEGDEPRELILDDQTVDSVGLKCLVVSRGLKVDREVYQRCGGSLEVWDDRLAEKYGSGKAFSDSIIGLEPPETLTRGACFASLSAQPPDGAGRSR